MITLSAPSAEVKASTALGSVALMKCVSPHPVPWQTRTSSDNLREGRYVKTPTFGLFDHIEGIPGDTPTKIFQDRLDFIRRPRRPGFASFHLAEHHGTDLSMAPNQDVFIAAASQITENIRLGPMVKLLPMHHPVQVVEDLCVLDHLTERPAGLRRRPRRGPRRARVARRRLPQRARALRRLPRDHRRGAAQRRGLQREQRVPRLPDDAADDGSAAGADPLLVPGQPDDGRPLRHEPHHGRARSRRRPTRPTSRRGRSTRASASASTARAPSRPSPPR